MSEPDPAPASASDHFMHRILRWLALLVATLALGRLTFHGVHFIDLLATFSERATPSGPHVWVDGANAYWLLGGKLCVVALAVLVGSCRAQPIIGDSRWARRAMDYLRATEAWWVTALFVTTLAMLSVSVWLPLQNAANNAWPSLASAASGWAQLWRTLVPWTSASFILWWLVLVSVARRECRIPRALWMCGAGVSCLGVVFFGWGLLHHLQSLAAVNPISEDESSVFALCGQRLGAWCSIGATCWLVGAFGMSVGWCMFRAPDSSLHWRTTFVILGVALTSSVPLFQAGSAFAWENTHRLGARSGPAGSAACCAFSVENLATRRAEHGIPSLLVPGRVHALDGAQGLSAQGLSAQELTRALSLQSEAGRPPDSDPVLGLLTTGDSSVRQLEAALEAVLDSGQDSVRLLSWETHFQERPLLGPWRNGTLTTLPAVVTREPGKCLERNAELVHLVLGAGESLSWFRDLLDRTGPERLTCLLLPPVACATSEPCVDPRRSGWVVTDSAALGSRAVALRFKGRRGEHLTAFIPKTESIQVLSRVQGDEPFETFPELERQLHARGRRLLWAMNGGMYMQDRRALGLLVSDGVQLARLNQRTGKGNFYLDPNGVFMISGSGQPEIVTTAEYARTGSATPAAVARQATQSGPIVIESGAVNPLFDPESTSRFVRNGVCVGNRYLVFDISTTRVSFHEFASFLRDLGCADALYLDGNVSSVYAPAAGREDSGFGLGPVVVATEPLSERN